MRPIAGSTFREQRTGLEYLRPVAEIRERGLHVRLHAYETLVYWQMRELHDSAGVWARLAERLGGAGVPSLEDALRDQQLGPVHDTLRGVIAEPTAESVERFVRAVADATGTGGTAGRAGTPGRPGTAGRAGTKGGASGVDAVVGRIVELAARAEPMAVALDDPSHAAAIRVWTLLGHSDRCPRVRRSGRQAEPGTRSCASPPSLRTRSGAGVSTKRPHGGPLSACAPCSTSRSQVRWAATRPPCHCGSWMHGSPTPPSARSSG